MSTRPKSRTRARILRVEDDRSVDRSDYLATEEPLEIRVQARAGTRTVALTMRTPGADFELAAGFLHGEGVLASAGDVRRITYCAGPDSDAEQTYNSVRVELTTPELPELAALDRHFLTSSACGVCGRASLDALVAQGRPPLAPGPTLDADRVCRLPGKLREAQDLFDSTGGLHAAGLFDAEGELLCVREDVGRHNAVDKVVGWALLAGRLPLSGYVLMVSGRASYEVVQKALAAGVPVVCSVSAPSSLAVDMARRFGMTLVGFLRERRFNVYAGEERVRLSAGAGVHSHLEGGEA